MENRRSTDEKMPRGVWKEVENRKTDEARMAKTKGERGKEREEKTNNRRRKNDSKISGRKRVTLQK